MAKAQYIGVSGVARKVKQPYVGIDGVARKVKSGYVGVDGVARQYFSRVSGTPLSDIAEGSIVLMENNGAQTLFIVAQHNYQPDLNGAGRTLLVQSYALKSTKWLSSLPFDSAPTYAGSTIDNLCATYFGDFGAAEQAAIGTTKFYVTNGSNTSTPYVLERNVFVLSLYEYVSSSSIAGSAKEGLVLPIDIKITTNKAMTAVAHWTRTPHVAMNRVYSMTTSGGYTPSTPTTSAYFRPAFTLPATSMFTDSSRPAFIA